MDLHLGPKQYVMYPAPEVAPPTERALAFRSYFYFLLFIASFMTGFLGLLLGVVVITVQLMGNFSSDDALFPSEWIPIYVLGIGLLPILALLTRTRVRPVHQQLAYFYEEVPQGKIVELKCKATDDRVSLLIVVEGYNRLNQLRRHARSVPVDDWRAYSVGQFVDFR